MGSTTSTAPSAAGAAAVGIGQVPASPDSAAPSGDAAGGSAQAPSRPISITWVS